MPPIKPRSRKLYVPAQQLSGAKPKTYCNLKGCYLGGRLHSLADIKGATKLGNDIEKKTLRFYQNEGLIRPMCIKGPNQGRLTNRLYQTAIQNSLTQCVDQTGFNQGTSPKSSMLVLSAGPS